MERVKYTIERRVVAYVHRVEQAAPVNAVMMTKSAVERRRALVDVGITEAVQVVNREFAW